MLLPTLLLTLNSWVLNSLFYAVLWQVFELNEQLGQFQERLLDQTEELQHANAQLEVLRRERNSLQVEYEDQLKLVTDQRDHLQVRSQLVSLFSI